MDQIIDKIRAGRRFMLTSHRRPDGDAVGSEMALALMLESLGKEAVIRNRDPIPQAYTRLPGVDRIVVGEIPAGERYDAIFVIECPEKDRPGLARLDEYCIVNIDHHVKNRMYGQINWVETSACAIGEMLYDLAARLRLELTPAMATHIYLSIVTDTGFFHFSNSSARAFEICADLTRHGANPHFVADALLDHNSSGQVYLLGRCLSRLQLHPELSAASIVLRREDLHGIDVGEGDTEGIINHPRSIDGVDIAIFYKEVDPANWRVGMRSRTDVNVAEVAAEFGGGGHPQASGCSIEGDLETVKRKLEDALRRKMAVRCAATAAKGTAS